MRAECGANEHMTTTCYIQMLKEGGIVKLIVDDGLNHHSQQKHVACHRAKVIMPWLRDNSEQLFHFQSLMLETYYEYIKRHNICNQRKW